MKNDPIIQALIGFLVPVILLYGAFFFADFFEVGFFALIYCLVLFVSGAMIFSARSSALEMLSAVQIEFLSFFVLLVSLAYIAGIIISITDLFSI